MNAITKISGKYQVTLPRAVRKKMKARVGDLLVFVQEADGTFRIRVVPAGLMQALRVAGQDLSPADFRTIHSEFEEGWEDEH